MKFTFEVEQNDKLCFHHHRFQVNYYSMQAWVRLLM